MTTLDDTAREDAIAIATAALDLWDGEVDSDGNPCTFHNYYQCIDCDIDWEDFWSCACDDECPRCEYSISPIKSLVYNWETDKWDERDEE